MWAGANNPLYIVQENRGLSANTDIVSGTKRLTDVRPDKQPVGFHHSFKPFTNHLFELQKGDLLYLFSDGYPDQFGGEKGKKFMTKNLKELFLANAHLSVSEQKAQLERTLSDWIGKLEQVDDITVAGIRI
jgi:serine phosphatase RsbU (regulator of sigma subunit)